MLIENTIMIDEFTPGYDYYFLTHFHSDHYKGLNSKWQSGRIIASEITCKLVNKQLGISYDYLMPINEGKVYNSKKNDISFYTIDAGHCVGALIFIFSINGKKIVYTGDFRLNDEIRGHIPKMKDADILYVDTTYQKSKKKFPTQEAAIKQIIEIIEDYHTDHEVWIAVYTIGKNKIIKQISEHFGKKFYVTGNIYEAWEVFGHDQYATRNPEETNFKAYQRGYFNNRKSIPKETIAIIPTAMNGPWDYLRGTVFKIDYSEHCDIFELREFHDLIKPKSVVKI